MQRRIQVLLAGAALGLAGGAHAQSNEELKAMLEQAMKTIQDLQGRVKALEQQRGAPAAAPAPAQTPIATPSAPAAPAAPAGAQEPAVAVVAPGSVAEEGAPEPGRARVELYGQVMLDAIHDFRKSNPDWNATLRPSLIPVNCPGDPGCGKDGASILSIRQSSLGVRASIPTSLGLLKTDFSFDLFGSDGSTKIHWLQAWATLGMYGAGQTYSNFMDIDVFPNVLDYWGPSGMTFLRNPQLRITPLQRDGMTMAFSWELPYSAIDTGKVSELAPEFGNAVTPWNRVGDLVGSFRLDRDWGHVRAAAILRKVGYQVPATATGDPAGQFTGYGLTVTGSWNVYGKNKITYQVVGGNAIASYMNDGGYDLAPDASLRGTTVRSLGWHAFYNHFWAEKWSSSIGYSQHRQDNTGGQLDTAFHKGSYASVNLLYYPVKNMTTGLEFAWGERENKDGATGSTYRAQFSTRVAF